MAASEAVLEYAERARARHDELAGAEVAFAEAGEQLSAARAELERRRAGAAQGAVSTAARSFAPAVREQLAALAMEDASFEVLLEAPEPGPRAADASSS